MAENNKQTSNRPIEVETLMKPIISRAPGIPLYIAVHVRPFPIAGAEGGFHAAHRLEHYIQLSALPEELRDRVRDYIKQLMRV